MNEDQKDTVRWKILEVRLDQGLKSSIQLADLAEKLLIEYDKLQKEYQKLSVEAAKYGVV